MSAYYASLMDGTDYRTLEAYLDSPISPIQCILHVRKPELVPLLAERIGRALEEGKAAPEHVRGLVLPMMEQGNLLLTTRRPMLLPMRSMVESSTIEKDSRCMVIYLPPFYLSHTEGLFECIENRLQPKIEPPSPVRRIKA